jgi:hypothetical protein
MRIDVRAVPGTVCTNRVPDASGQFPALEARDVACRVHRHPGRDRSLDRLPAQPDEPALLPAQRRQRTILYGDALSKQMAQTMTSTVAGMQPPRYADAGHPQGRRVGARCAVYRPGTLECLCSPCRKKLARSRAVTEPRFCHLPVDNRRKNRASVDADRNLLYTSRSGPACRRRQQAVRHCDSPYCHYPAPGAWFSSEDRSAQAGEPSANFGKWRSSDYDAR